MEETNVVDEDAEFLRETAKGGRSVAWEDFSARLLAIAERLEEQAPVQQTTVVHLPAIPAGYELSMIGDMISIAPIQHEQGEQPTRTN